MLPRTLTMLLLLALLLGCAAPPVPTQPPAPPPPAPAPAAPAAPAAREDVNLGLWEGRALFLEYRGDGTGVIWSREQESVPERIAELPVPHRFTPIWHHVSGNRLFLTVPTQTDTLDELYRIDLPTGTVTGLGRLMTERLRWEAVSPDQRYLGVKHNGLPFGLELIDLETGTRTLTGSESQPGGFAWAPTGSRWAVRAAQPGSGLPVSITFRWAEGASHLDIGQGTGGEPRHLYPPAPLVLVGGPVWAPDGNQVAVSAGVVSTEAGEPVEQSVWVVKVETNEWSKLYDLKPGERLSGRLQKGTLWP